jgi:hypothetical protein
MKPVLLLVRINVGCVLWLINVEGCTDIKTCP